MEEARRKIIQLCAVATVVAVVITSGVILNLEVHKHYTRASVEDIGFSHRRVALECAADQTHFLVHGQEKAMAAYAAALSSSLVSPKESEEFGWLSTPMIRALNWHTALSMPSLQAFSVLCATGGEIVGFMGAEYFSMFVNSSTPTLDPSSELVGFESNVRTGESNVSAISKVTAAKIREYAVPPALPFAFVENRVFIDYVSHLPLGTTEFTMGIAPDLLGTGRRTAMTISAPIKHLRTGETVAVAVTEIYSFQLSAFLRTHRSRHPGSHAYIATRSGVLLATSCDDEVVRENSASTFESGLVEVWHAPIPLIKESAMKLLQIFGSWEEVAEASSSDNVHIYDVDMDGGAIYFLDTTMVPISSTSDASVMCVLITPRAAILGGTDKAFKLQLSINLAVAVVSLFMGCAVTFMGFRRVLLLQRQKEHYLQAKVAAEESKDRFLANTSHEIRTPMAGIIGLLELTLANPALTLQVREDINTMQSCATTMLSLLNDILDVQKMKHGDLALERAPFDARGCVESCVALFACTMIKKGLEIGLDYAQDAPRMLIGDAGRLKQVVTNLLSNASKFTKKGYVAVRVWEERTVSEQFHSRQLWCLEVEDTGCGISEGKEDLIFEAFEQDTTSSSGSWLCGTGLGLNVVRSLVLKMGGRVYVLRKETSGGEGTGCRFRVKLPVEAELLAPTSTPVSTPRGRREARALLSSTSPAPLSPLPHTRVTTGTVTCVVLVTMQCLMSSFLPRSLRHHFEAPCVVVESLDAVLQPHVLPRGRTVQLVLLVDYKTCIEEANELALGKWWLQLKHLVLDFPKQGTKGRPNSNGRRSVLMALGCSEPLLPKPWVEAASEKNMDWETVVTLGSSGLVIPSRVIRLVRHVLGVPCACPDCCAYSPYPSDEDDSATDRGNNGGRGNGSSEEDGKEILLHGYQETKEERRENEGASAGPVLAAGGITKSQEDSMETVLRILVVEDNLVNQKVVRRMLQGFQEGMNQQGVGLLVQVVENGEEAVEAFGSGPAGERLGYWNLILMDLQMPVCDGFEATRRIREMEATAHVEAERRVYISALTANTLICDQKRCFALGMDECLTKPINRRQMEKLVYSLLE